MPTFTFERTAFLRATVHTTTEAEARALAEAEMSRVYVGSPRSTSHTTMERRMPGVALELSLDDGLAELVEINGREPD